MFLFKRYDLWDQIQWLKYFPALSVDVLLYNIFLLYKSLLPGVRDPSLKLKVYKSSIFFILNRHQIIFFSYLLYMYIYWTQSEIVLYVVSFHYSWKNTITGNMYLIINTLLVYMTYSQLHLMRLFKNTMKHNHIRQVVE